jgi:hypothetical protein
VGQRHGDTAAVVFMGRLIMKKCVGLAILVTVACTIAAPLRADEGQATSAVLDKALRALGGEERLSKIKAATWKAKGKIRLSGQDQDFSSEVAVQGMDQYREVFYTDLLGKKTKSVAVLYGDKGYRHIADVDTELDRQDIADLRRTVYLLVLPTTIVPLKGKAYRLEGLGEQKVGDQVAVGIRATGPDGKDFRLYFDKDSGLPIRLLAEVVGAGGGEFPQETTYANYKEFDGIKKATKITIKRDGERFIEEEISAFKIVDKLDEKTFLKPE